MVGDNNLLKVTTTSPSPHLTLLHQAYNYSPCHAQSEGDVCGIPNDSNLEKNIAFTLPKLLSLYFRLREEVEWS